MLFSHFKKFPAKFILFVILIVLFSFVSKYFSMDQDSYQSFLQGFPLVLSGIIFIVLYVVVTSIVWLGPKDLFRVVSALLYGAGISTILVSIGEMINAIAMFMLSRKLGREYVAGKLKGGMKRLDEAVTETGFWSIFFLKVFPIVPFRFLDLGFGLTRIRLKKYLFISALGAPMRIFFQQFFLSMGVETATNPHKLAEYLTENPHIWWFCFFYCLGSFGLMYYMKKKHKK